MTKACDHEIMKVLETLPKAIPRAIESEICVVRGLQVQCKDICDRALDQMLVHYNPIQDVGPPSQ